MKKKSTVRNCNLWPFYTIGYFIKFRSMGHTVKVTAVQLHIQNIQMKLKRWSSTYQDFPIWTIWSFITYTIISASFENVNKLTHLTSFTGFQVQNVCQISLMIVQCLLLWNRTCHFNYLVRIKVLHNSQMQNSSFQNKTLVTSCPTTETYLSESILPKIKHEM